MPLSPEFKVAATNAYIDYRRGGIKAVREGADASLIEPVRGQVKRIALNAAGSLDDLRDLVTKDLKVTPATLSDLDLLFQLRGDETDSSLYDVILEHGIDPLSPEALLLLGLSADTMKKLNARLQVWQMRSQAWKAAKAAIPKQAFQD